MALASTPAEALTSKEIDALRQVAYELEQLSWGDDSGTGSSKAKCHMVAARIENGRHVAVQRSSAILASFSYGRYLR
jgi:hypothetical protein